MSDPSAKGRRGERGGREESGRERKHRREKERDGTREKRAREAKNRRALHALFTACVVTQAWSATNRVFARVPRLYLRIHYRASGIFPMSRDRDIFSSFFFYTKLALGLSREPRHERVKEKIIFAPKMIKAGLWRCQNQNVNRCACDKGWQFGLQCCV